MDLIRVGKFELYPSERLLCRDGQRVELGARAFDLLLVLAESPGRLVTKNTLLERVWPRLIVDENNLPAQIASLRRVLGAGAIRTVPGFGYRLELEVTAGETVGVTDAAPRPKARELTHLSIPRRARPERLVPLVGRGAELLEVQEALTQGVSCHRRHRRRRQNHVSPRRCWRAGRSRRRRSRLGLAQRNRSA